MEEKIRLNDGTEIAGYCLVNAGDLTLYLSSITLDEAYQLVSVPENTKVIQYINGKTYTYRGYKHLYAIREEVDEMITASLRKG